jgi:lysyl-tRNA synthetase class 2
MVSGREKQIVDERIRKIEALRSEGVEPYAHRFDLDRERVHSVDAKEKFAKLKSEGKSGKSVVVAGRVMMKRSFGKLSFFSLQDLRGSIQVVIQAHNSVPSKLGTDVPSSSGKGEVNNDVVKMVKKIDAGDIVGVKGEVVKTRTGEVSIMAQELFVLTKAILPLPDKHKGLKDEEEKLRKRYLDIIMNEDVKGIFVKKSRFWGAVRGFLSERGFLEVETPILENSAGGAAATPFATHHNALNVDVFLRISMGELWQKKLLVAGYEKTFEIGRQFRNEGMDAEHLQDYSQMEFYWGYADFEDGMKMVEEMYKEIAMATLGKLKFESAGHKIDLGKKWKRYDFEKLIKEKTGIGIYEADKGEIVAKLRELKMEFDDGVGKWRLVDLLWKYCRKDISGPGFLVGQPVELTPLAKRSRSDPRKVEQFQVILAGSEMGNGYSELNDPIDQDERFREQRALGEEGDADAMEHDESYIEALKYGMPPACGFGFSERLFWIMMDRPGRECVAFPLMRPVEKKEKKEK